MAFLALQCSVLTHVSALSSAENRTFQCLGLEFAAVTASFQACDQTSCTAPQSPRGRRATGVPRRALAHAAAARGGRADLRGGGGPGQGGAGEGGGVEGALPREGREAGLGQQRPGAVVPGALRPGRRPGGRQAAVAARPHGGAAAGPPRNGGLNVFFCICFCFSEVSHTQSTRPTRP